MVLYLAFNPYLTLIITIYVFNLDRKVKRKGKELKNKMDANEKYIQLAETDPSFIIKRRLLVCAFGLRMFFIGVEYSVILPSALLYMETFNVGAVMDGFVIAAYPFAGMIALPIFGRIYDKTRKTRQLIFVLNTFQIIGNVIYAIPFSQWLPLSGRFIAGLGDGFLACATGEIMHIYPKCSRTGIISLLELGRVLGLIIGPAINFFIGKKTYYLWTWRLDYATLPGVIMAMGWILMQIVTMCLVFNLSKEIQDTFPHDKMENKMSDIDSSRFEGSPQHEEGWAFDDTFYLIGNEEGLNKNECEAFSSEDRQTDENEMVSIRSALKEFCTCEFLILAYIDIVLWTSQTEFEILLPYVTEFNYGWTPAWTGLIYMIGGFELIVIFLALYYIDTHYVTRDTYLLLLSLFLTQVSLGLLICEGVPTKINYRIIIFGFICLLVFTSIPFNLVASKSLISKITRPQTQGFIQGIYASVTRIALIVGPIIGSLVFRKREIYGIVASIVCFNAIIGLMLCMDRLHKREDDMTEAIDINED